MEMECQKVCFSYFAQEEARNSDEIWAGRARSEVARKPVPLYVTMIYLALLCIPGNHISIVFQ